MKDVDEQSGWQPTVNDHSRISLRTIFMTGLVLAVSISGAVQAGEAPTHSDLGPSELNLSSSHGMSARVLQIGDLNDAVLRQSGNQHVGHMEQLGSANGINAIQLGSANQFVTSQTGSGNEIELTQAGRANTATVSQVGGGHRASIEQNGNANVVNVQQLPFSPNLLVQQHGHGLAAKVIQY